MYTKTFIKKFFFSSSIKMDKKNANFGDKKTKQVPFTKAKKFTKINYFDNNNILVSEEEPYGKKNSFK